ncbi:hypothetical protein ACOBQJ_08760 [Pelotomaculum propionicicum]|uniref:hypothetical protein n=1 Tax=Pelotomaculum propionicicum TaxID=258475 RepID=UPI003B7B5D39
MHKENDLKVIDVIEGIEGESLPETHIRTQAELARRERLEKTRRERDSLDDLNELAEFETRQSEIFLKDCKNIIRDNLSAGADVNWASLYNDKPYPPFVYKNPAPRYNLVAREKGVPQKRFFSELLFPSVKNARMQKENDAKAAYDLKTKQYEEGKEAGRATHEKERGVYLAGQSAYNSKVEELQLNFEKGDPAAVRSFARIALHGINLPDSINLYFDAAYLPGEKQLVIDCLLPAYYDLPRAVSYSYNKESGALVPAEMGEREYDAFYLDLIRQIALTAINTVINAIPGRLVERVGFNGWVENDKIGNTLETKACVITCDAARDVFAALDLLKCAPADCIRQLGGLTAKSMAGSDTVQPIVSAIPETDEAKRVPDNPEDGPKPPQYQPGEFKNVTKKLMGEMLEQIEKNLLQAARDKDDMVH